MKLEVNDRALFCGVKRNAQPLLLPRVDARVGVDHAQGAIIMRGSDDVAPLMRELRSSTFVLSRSLLIFCFAHGPPITQLLVPSHARRSLHALGAIHQV